MKKEHQEWSEEIGSKYSLFDLNLEEVWRYKDLVFMLIKKDFITSFKQTILGPIWFFLNPIFTTVVYVLIFGNIAKLPTDGIPSILFYLSGVTLWNYFSSCLSGVSNTFQNFSPILGKVYFPRLVIPISIVISNLMRFGVQMLLFFAVLFYYYIKGEVQPNYWVFFTPVFILLMAFFALGLGMIFSSLTTKYRDMSMLLGFGISLYMYATPVILPTSVMPEKIKPFLAFNPLTGIFEGFKYAFMGVGDFNGGMLAISALMIMIVFLIGLVVFNKIQRSFMDTV